MMRDKVYDNWILYRSSFYNDNPWGIPNLENQNKEINLKNLKLIGFNDIRPDDTEENRDKTVHFFMFDYQFYHVFEKPYRCVDKLKQYRQVISPDYSLYIAMPLAVQIQNTFKRRWCSAFWQSKGMVVIPAVGWGDERSFDFCFTGIEQGAIVAVSTVGTTGFKPAFLRGFKEMVERLQPEKIICYHDTFYKEMWDFTDAIIPIKRKKHGSAGKSGQLELFEDVSPSVT